MIYGNTQHVFGRCDGICARIHVPRYGTVLIDFELRMVVGLVGFAPTNDAAFETTAYASSATAP